MDNISFVPPLSFQEKIEGFIKQHPGDIDKIQHFLKEQIPFATQEDLMRTLPLLKQRLKSQGIEDARIQAIDTIFQERLRKTRLLDLPHELITDILTRFAKSDNKGWEDLLHSQFSAFLNHPEMIVALLDRGLIPEDRKLEFAKLAGPRIIRLDLHDLNMTDQMLEELFAACPNIQELDLSNCSQLTPAVIEKLPQKLESLHLAYWYNLTPAAIAELPQGLLSLNLAHTGLTRPKIEKLPKGLKSLNLQDCSQLTKFIIEKLPQGLTTLDLSNNSQLTDDKIEKLPQGLESLSLRHCHKLTDKIIEKLPQGIKSLDLSHCYNLTDAIVEKLPKGLTVIDLTDCNYLTNTVIEKLQERPGLKVIYRSNSKEEELESKH